MARGSTLGQNDDPPICTGLHPIEMKPADTSEEAYQRQLEVWRNMTGGERLQRALEMSEFVRECAKSRIRKDHRSSPRST